MLKLFFLYLEYSFFGKVLKSIIRIQFIVSKSFNDYFSYIELLWHYDRPRLFKTIYYNFRLCPLRQAVLCPLYIYGKTRTWSLRGKIVIDSNNIKSGMVKWGYDWGYRSNGVTIVRIEGEVHFNGICTIAKATDIAVFTGASLFFGRGGEILENTLIYCADRITIGDNFSFTFQSSMMDTDFHYMLDIAKSRITRKTAPIIIGDNVWVGNRATIKKGVRIPDNTIIAASYSVLTKDYSQLPPYSIIGGCPAKLLTSGYSRVWKEEMTNVGIFDKFFIENPEENFIQIDKKKQSDYIYE